MRQQRRRSHLFTGVFVAAVMLASCSSNTADSAHRVDDTASTTVVPPVRAVAVAEVSEPIAGEPWTALSTVPDDSEYMTTEYFISGTATSYRVDGEMGTDGRWDAVEDDSARYTTRILVRRPIDVDHFNGTVVVEWLNVSAGFETAPDFLFTQAELLRSGYAWIGVSAQKDGIENSDADRVAGIGPLKEKNPERYAPLVHPGDEFSYDIFSQAGAVARSDAPDAPLAGYDVDLVIADGESQSANRMANYINIVQPVTNAFDGFMVHSRWAEETELNPTQTPPVEAVLRTDTTVPVLQVLAETDVELYLPARQDDTDIVRTWEIAGTAHVDSNVIASTLTCDAPVNSGPQIHVMAAALDALHTWVEDPSTPPPTAPRIDVDDTGVVVRDANGNAVGGIRTPHLDVPAATLSGMGGSGPGFCMIAGTTSPFESEKLNSLYGSRDKYLEKFEASMNDAISRGFLLVADAPTMLGGASANWPA